MHPNYTITYGSRFRDKKINRIVTSDEVRKNTTYHIFFREDGSIRINKTNPSTYVEEAYSEIDDLSKCYETYPDFGKYDASIKKEMESTPILV